MRISADRKAPLLLPGNQPITRARRQAALSSRGLSPGPSLRGILGRAAGGARRLPTTVGPTVALGMARNASPEARSGNSPNPRRARTWCWARRDGSPGSEALSGFGMQAAMDFQTLDAHG